MNPPLADDAAWWRSACEGDGEAFGRLFDRHSDRVFRHASRLMELHHEAEDVTAATFLELWRRRDDVRLVDDSVLPWLLVTALNLSRNVSRSTRRHRAFLARLPRVTSAPDAADVALGQVALNVGEPLRTALRSLSPKDLQLFALVVLDDLTLEQAAAVLGITASAAKARVHRTRHRLRAELQDDDGRSPTTTRTSVGGD